ncbi:hypothetical protein MMC13_001406 [Lambiella insularis]|nr:hypothetical protein [Lambiella insularis]
MSSITVDTDSIESAFAQAGKSSHARDRKEIIDRYDVWSRVKPMYVGKLSPAEIHSIDRGLALAMLKELQALGQEYSRWAKDNATKVVEEILAKQENQGEGIQGEETQEEADQENVETEVEKGASLP